MEYTKIYNFLILNIFTIDDGILYEKCFRYFWFCVKYISTHYIFFMLNICIFLFFCKEDVLLNHIISTPLFWPNIGFHANIFFGALKNLNSWN